MSILVKGMKMPETCIECPMQFGGFCGVMPANVDESRVFPTVDECWEKKKPTWCPLEEVEKMTRAELMNLVGKKVMVYFKDGERGIYGTLGYVKEFSEKYGFRKPGYFYIGNRTFDEKDFCQCIISEGTPLPEMCGESINKMHLIRKIRDCAKKYPQDYGDKIYDAVTIYEGIEEVSNCGVRKGLELAISIIEEDKEAEDGKN